MGLESFFAWVRRDVEEFLTTGKMQRAVELSAQTGQHFNHNEYPMFFVGDPTARLVLVHLNPKQPNNHAPTYQGKKWLPTVDRYIEYHQYFGAEVYGPNAKHNHKSPFDHKQIRFLRPFGMIDFGSDVRVNLERVIDHKLQLELIPYGSNTFETRGFTPAILQPHLERVLDVISAYPRDYVLFCGSVFEPLLQEHIVQQHSFYLTKNDGSPTQQQARFARLVFPYNGQLIQAGLCHSFARQGIPMEDYGRRCKALYDQEIG